ncbi:hypothetical protein RclHR1_05400002 [Rhizophagus clarus]|nr:hypothetical protein RclHR1_05400002 [Rhizophagus clarus]
MNSSYSFQPNTLNVANTAQDIPVVLNENRPHESITMTSITTPPTMPRNENQLFHNNNIQAMLPIHSLQTTQDYRASYPYSLTHYKETTVINEFSFFYKPCNDFQMYHIVCEEIPLSFEFVARLINNPDPIRSDRIYRFYHEQPEVKKIYQVTCKMIPHEFVFQFLNKIIYNIQFTNVEYQEQGFSELHQENLKFHLKRDLVHYLVPKDIYEDNYNLQKRLVQDYCDYESMMNSNTGSFDKFQHQSFAYQHDNKCRLVCLQNDKNGSVNYNQRYYKNP